MITMNLNMLGSRSSLCKWPIRRLLHSTRSRNSTCSSTLTNSSADSVESNSSIASLELRAKAQSRIADQDLIEPRSVSPFLTDSFGRKHDYLRISLTEKCNLRCTYCMPEQGVSLLPKDDLLTASEIERVAKMFVAHGVTKIRLTGGEPTIRRDLLEIVSRLGKLGLKSLGMTSNGIALTRKLPSLVEAGLTHLNLSLDTLDPFKYELMTRRKGFSAVMDALNLAQGFEQKGLQTKLNVVVIRGLNDVEVPEFVEMTRERNLTVRFIEYMPFQDNRWSREKLVPSASLVSGLKANFPNLEKLVDPHSDTTRSYRVPGYRGRIGFISSMSNHFCGECSRLRISPDGKVKVCLFGPPVLSLREGLRSRDTSDTELMQRVGKAVWGKKFAHNGLGVTRRRSSISSQQIQVPLHLLGSAYTRPFVQSRAYSTTRPVASESKSNQLSHIDPNTGKAAMVNVSDKEITQRSATAVGFIYLNEKAFSLIDFESTDSDSEPNAPPRMHTKKGDVLTVAQLAAILGVKQTSSLIPLCHPLQLSHIKVDLIPVAAKFAIKIQVTAECCGQTGVEMEALTGVSVGLLTVWDMCKAVAGQEMRIGDIFVAKKSGGQSGNWERGDFTESAGGK